MPSRSRSRSRSHSHSRSRSRSQPYDPNAGDHASMTTGRNKRLWYAVAQMTQTDAAKKKGR
ncbi:hypothetical protein M378DRAFT_169269 [Amanita muscaria Koide BX008]|uniref:Uncharacterized protein n=1 Tax=Amanita muscaria (strain Koide BX008) TaxID=946122 RepID=A0A0C2S9L0_AMAMK|nr:hypothetical protein M378DRAFT_169269 [Amanita muscaria Koide BX008]